MTTLYDDAQKLRSLDVALMAVVHNAVLKEILGILSDPDVFGAIPNARDRMAALMKDLDEAMRRTLDVRGQEPI